MSDGIAAAPLYDYQQAWFADKSRFKIGMWSRQVGKTFATTLEIVDDVMAARAEKRASPWLILSRGDRQAREAMRAGIQTHAKAYGLVFEESEYDLEIEGQRYRANEWDAGGGNIVTALPANPDTARGYSRNVYLDEFAIHRSSREIWGALYPSITRGWKLRITSTPKGKSGKFYELMTSDGEQWSKHVVDIHRAVAGGLPVDADELRAGLSDEDLWRQEYLCEWLDEASAWLPYDLIDACESPEAGRPELYGGGLCFLGNDIGRRRHLWCAVAAEMIGDVAWTREIRELSREKFSVQDKVLDEMVERYRTVRIAMDQTGMGEKPVEDAQSRYGASRVEGVLFSQASKLHMATCLKERFEDRKIRIPAGNAVLRSDLHSVQKVAGPTGQVRLLAEETKDGHADRFWALALMASAADSGAGPVDGLSLPPREAYGAFADTASQGRARENIDYDLGIVHGDSRQLGGFY